MTLLDRGMGDTSSDWTISTGVTGGPPPSGTTVNDCYNGCDAQYPNSTFSWITGNSAGDTCYAGCATQYGVSLMGQGEQELLCGRLPFNVGCGSEVPSSGLRVL